MEDLFEDLLEEKNINPVFSKSDKIIISVEDEFREKNSFLTEEEKSRKDEEETLIEKKKKLEEKLKKYRNIRNPKLVHVNSQRAQKRKEIKQKIADCNLRLQEIKVERG
jgi:hypothetical protein